MKTITTSTRKFVARYYWLLLSLVLLFYFGFWWFYKLDTLPGLHGDEAWVGLEAHNYLMEGISSYVGMNNYTGILQTLLNALSFKFFGIGVFQLRYTTVLFNFLGMGMILFSLAKINKLSAFIFLLIFAQSALFLTSARIAWEVNTFHLFFIGILFVCFIKIKLDGAHWLWYFVFLMAVVMGGYNHIIFSSLIFSAWTGLIFHALYTNTIVQDKLILIPTFSLFDSGLVFLSMRYWPEQIFEIGAPTLIVFLIMMSAFQAYIIYALNFTHKPVQLKNGRYLILLILTICVCYFIKNHGIAFFQVLSNYKIFANVFAFKANWLTKLFFFINASFLCFYLVRNIVNDIIRAKDNGIFAFIVLTYIGILSLYTTNNSFRYYIILYVLMAIYLSLKIGQTPRRFRTLVLAMIASVTVTNIVLVCVFFVADRPMSAFEIKIGNSRIENSGHFLPNKPLIDFLRKNNIENVRYLSERYFIEEPVLFYRLANPWKSIMSHDAIVEYSSNSKNGGYLMYSKTTAP